MAWWRRAEKASKPFYFYGWRDGHYVLEHQGRFGRLADARVEALRIAGRLAGTQHLHILDQDHRLLETISVPPASLPA